MQQPKSVSISSQFEVYEDISSLSEADKKLMLLAIEARKNAYAPYSNFLVGASILLDNGEVIKGNNQENAAYPSGLCAERIALFYAGANFPNSKILKIAVTASSSQQITKEPIPPCGACRQSISEYEIKQNQPIEILFMGAKGKVVKSTSLSNLLPFAFDKSML